MKTIKIFLASSEELKNERIAFGNLVRQLDDIFMRRGTHIQLVVWEELNTTFSAGRSRTQDEYNEKVRQCDIFVAMFHTRAGQYTLEEVDVAMDENTRRQAPKLLIYCRELKPDEQESPELTKFKQRLDHELQYFWKKYASSDSMQLDFVMWLNRNESYGRNALKVENDEVTLGGVAVARTSNLPFFAMNHDYSEMQVKIASLNNEIDQLSQAVEQMPAMSTLKDMLQSKLNERNQLREKMEQYQSALLGTANRIAEMQLETVSTMLRRAIEAFENGNLAGANALLDEIAYEADQHMVRLEQDRDLVHQDIDAFQLQAKTVLADLNIPIDDRIDRIIAIYAKADDWAQRSNYNKGQYFELLYDYAIFLSDYAYYKEAEKVVLRQISLSEELKGDGYLDALDIATCYDILGWIYYSQGKYAEALDIYHKSLDIEAQESSIEESLSDYFKAANYEAIGMVYISQEENFKALEYHLKALDIKKRLFGDENPETAISYSCIGSVYYSFGEYAKALDYYLKALDIEERVHGLEHPNIAIAYNKIGMVFFIQGEYTKALEYYLKALDIEERSLGLEHPSTAITYTNIGLVHYCQSEYEKALEYHLKVLDIEERSLGLEHPSIAITYTNIGEIYCRQGEYAKAMEFHLKALGICEQVLGFKHLYAAASYEGIGKVHYSQGDYSKALDYYLKALDIREQVVGLGHPDTAESYNDIGLAYYYQGEYSKALEYYLKALDIREQVLRPNHPDTLAVRNNIKIVKAVMGQV